MAVPVVARSLDIQYQFSSHTSCIRHRKPKSVIVNLLSDLVDMPIALCSKTPIGSEPTHFWTHLTNPGSIGP
jgi:hypothetical protein